MGVWGRGGDDESAKEHLEQQQALVKQLAEILDFVHKFDYLKVMLGWLVGVGGLVWGCGVGVGMMSQPKNISHLEQQQALVKQLAEILDFVFKFDDLKVMLGWSVGVGGLVWGCGVGVGDDESAKEHLEQQQALVKQLAEILDFVHKFDDLKVMLGWLVGVFGLVWGCGVGVGMMSQPKNI